MQSHSKFWSLHNHKIFSKISPKELEDLQVQVGFLNLRRNEHVKLLSEKTRNVYFLKRGVLKVVRIDGKREKIVDLIYQDDVFGEIVTDSEHRKESESVKVLSEEAVICTFTKENLEKLLLNNPLICFEYTKVLGSRLLTVQQKYSDLLYKDAKTRIMELISELKSRNTMFTGTFKTCALTHQDIADLTGCKRPTVTTILKELHKEFPEKW